jgi:hypothetical protein
MKYIPLLVTFAGLTVHAGAVTTLLDFGRTANSTAGYNNVSTASNNLTTPIVVNDLIDTTAVSTPWDISVSSSSSPSAGSQFGAAGAAANAIAFPVSLSSFATTALEDSLFANARLNATVSITVTLTQLSLTETYDLLFYGSRANGSNINQTWTLITGTGSAAPVTHDSLANSTTVVNWTGIAPNSSGIISFTISGTSLGANTNAVALNFGSITSTAIPEPSSILAFIFAGSLLGLRRR